MGFAREWDRVRHADGGVCRQRADGAKRLECVQLAAAVESCDQSGSKLHALQKLARGSWAPSAIQSFTALDEIGKERMIGELERLVRTHYEIEPV
jgi:hypothetical protein